MASPIHHMTVIRYYRDRPDWDAQQIDSPSWSDVEPAIRRMDNYCFPAVQLKTTKTKISSIFLVAMGAGLSST